MTPPYDLYIEPDVHKQRNNLPGHLRQRVRSAISELAIQPRPHNSRKLDVASVDLPTYMEIRRLRIEQWRIIYYINEDEHFVWVWGLRKRPPYDYEDMPQLLQQL
ncbi:MAG: hypothetical protein R3E79_18720 [Caldilineaceae bacterium]